jgi:hypothetical protein
MQDVYTRMTADAPPVAGALEHLAALPGDLYLVSARRLKSVRYAQQWLMKHGVFDVIPAERMFFCESKKDKRPICDRLGIKTFVDDQLAVLELLSPRMKRVLLDVHGVRPRLTIEEGYEVADGWAHVRELIGN